MPSLEYKAELDSAWDLHVRKNAGYAGADNPDPWANFRMCEAFGITAFQGCMVRMSDKYIRVTNLMRNAANDQVGESLIDTLRDLAAYALIGVVLLQEPQRVNAAPVEQALALAGEGRWIEAMVAAGFGREEAERVLDDISNQLGNLRRNELRLHSVPDLAHGHAEAVHEHLENGEPAEPVIPMPMDDTVALCGLVIGGEVTCLRKRGHRGECYA